MHKTDYIKRLALSAVCLCFAVSGFSQNDSIDTEAKAKELLAKGVGYYTGRNGYQRDFQKAYDYLVEAAGYNSTDAECVLAHMYENGNGVEQDYSKAFEWYMKAAQKNSVLAQNSVAYFYDEGLGVDQSFIEAAKWYEKAADNNNGSAQYNLADMYAHGIGVDVDYDKALELYRKAMTNGVREASREIAKVTSLKNNPPSAVYGNNGEPVYVNPGVMPQFPGGNEACLRYLRDNIVYPPLARENKIEGRVVVSFTIGKDGAIRDPEVVRSVDGLLDKEALRVISEMPVWSPGYLNGEPVNVRYSIPINFRLTK